MKSYLINLNVNASNIYNASSLKQRIDSFDFALDTLNHFKQIIQLFMMR